MALSLDKELPTGIVVSYHRINKITAGTFNASGYPITVEVGSYVNAAMRHAGKAPVTVSIINLTLPDIDGELRTVLYGVLAAPMTFTTQPGNPALIPMRPTLGFEGAVSN